MMRIDDGIKAKAMSAIQPTVEQSWGDIEAINRSIQTAASDEAWEQVVELAVSRHRLLLNHFQQFPVGPEYAAFYQQHLTTMLDGERELQTLARDARKRVLREGTMINRNYRAVGAYLAQ